MSSKIFDPQGKLLLHFDQVNRWMKGENVAPIQVEISPSNACRASCNYCFYRGTHDKTFIDTEKLKIALDDMKEIGVKAIGITGGGEPTEHEDFDEIVDYTHKLKLEQGMFTNGMNQIEHPERFKWIRISVTNGKLYDKFINEWAKHTTVGVCLTIDRGVGIHKALGIMKEAQDANAHYFQIRPALGRGNIDFPYMVNIKSDIKFYRSEYKWLDYMGPKSYEKCYGHNFSPYLDSNGDVLSCAYHLKNKKYTFGNIYDNTFKHIWKHRNMKKIKMDKECITCCKLHEINKMLYFLKHGKETLEYVNFV